MNSSTLVSICIPTYNGAGYLSATLDCVSRQSHANLEVVFSDDGSNDGTLGLIESFAGRSPLPVKILHHQHTTLAGNWNNCVAHASGEYIKFLFQDDVMGPDCVSKLVARADADPSISLVFSSRDILVHESALECPHARNIAEKCSNLHDGWTNLRPLQEGRELLADPALMKGVWNKFGEPSIVLIRKQSLIDLGGFDPDLSQLIDLDMWYRLCAVGKVAFVDEVLSSFRVHRGQLSVRNAESGMFSNDVLTFARKTVNASHFAVLSPEAKEQFKQMSQVRKPPSKLRLLRRRIKRKIKDLFSL
jgi:glycosyltransferase involved in cell wall biosynthesis